MNQTRFVFPLGSFALPRPPAAAPQPPAPQPPPASPPREEPELRTVYDDDQRAPDVDAEDEPPEGMDG